MNRHCITHFTCIISFILHNDPVKLALLCLVADGEIIKQHVQGPTSNSGTARI